MTRRSVQPTTFPATTITAIQRNVDAHTPQFKYRDLYDDDEKSSFAGIPEKKWAARRLIRSAANSFASEFAEEFGRDNALLDAIVIMRKADRELEAEMAAEYEQMEVSFNA